MTSSKNHALCNGSETRARSRFLVIFISLSGLLVFPPATPSHAQENGQEPSPPAKQIGKSATVKSAPTAATTATNWQSLFDGKSLAGWKETDFAGRGGVKVESGKMLLESGVMTGVTWTNKLPRMDYELSLDAMRVEGSDFFCGLTFPVGKDPCSFIVGGWGGGVVGLSSIDNEDAAHNETTQYMNFTNEKWFAIRIRVTKNKIEAWIDSDKVVNLETEGKKISIRAEMELSQPLGIACWSTAAAVRNIRIRSL